MSDAISNEVDGENLRSLHDAALSELSSLGRVSHRLAMTDGGRPFEKVLSLFLPRLLRRIGSNHKRTLDLSRQYPNAAAPGSKSTEAVLKGTYDKVHAKLVEMIGHIMKRTRSDAACQIPCEAVLNILFDAESMKAHPPSSVDPFTLNLSLSFLTLGLPRCPAEEVEALLPGLMALVGAHSGDGVGSIQSAARRNQNHQCAHLLLRAVEVVVTGSRTVRDGMSAPSQPPSSSLAGHKATATSEISGNNKYIASVRMVCNDEFTGAAIYDLFMDALLYQPTAGSSGSGSLPCPGLSQSGFERLLGGMSLISKNWAGEYAATARLRDLKLCLLDFVAPRRRWAPFQGMEEEYDKGTSNLGVARSVALLVVTSGDRHPDVAERASSYLKAHMDTFRNVSSKDSGQGSSGDQKSTGLALLGDPIILTCSLLSLVLGENVAARIVGQRVHVTAKACLGVPIPLPDGTTPSGLRIVLLSTKRRMIADIASARLMTFISSHILDDIPKIFLLFSGRNHADPVGSAYIIGSLVVCACRPYLELGGNADIAGPRGGPRVAAARLLRSLCVRLALFYDILVNSSERLDDIHNLLAQAMALACSVLSAGSSRHTASSGSQNSVETRDICYGVIGTLARSQLALANGGSLFNCGELSTNASPSKMQSSVFSITTAALLFGCAANEEEALRPRSIAALDALLAAFCRLRHEMRGRTSESAPSEIDTSRPDLSNPWKSTIAEGKAEESLSLSAVESGNLNGLSQSLLPLLWSAAQTSQPKISRLAAARWSSELIKPLDLVSACHILCFISGDPDVTASSVAREGLSIRLTEENLGDIISGRSSKDRILPDFHEIVEALFSRRNITDGVQSRRPTYYDFSPLGQCAALRFGLICLMHDIYGGEDEGVFFYVSAISTTLSEIIGKGLGRGRDMTDLLDECSLCLSGCLASSSFARSAIVSKCSNFDHLSLAKLAVSANSSRARRHLAEACRYLYEDYAIWASQGTEIDLAAWTIRSGIGSSLDVCALKLSSMRTNLFKAGEIHGACLLGAACIRALRIAARCLKAATENEEVSKCWEMAMTILSALGRGTLHTDEVIGNACSNGTATAFSFDGTDAERLEEILFPGTAKTLVNLESALKKFGNGDHTDTVRASFLARAAGIALGASTSGSGSENNIVIEKTEQNMIGLGQARLSCVESLFALLGSTASRKDPEISLVVGEALACYADAYCPEGATWTTPNSDKPEMFDEMYSAELPPHKHVIYVLLEKELKSTSPHKRNACAPALLALVGRAARTLHNNKEAKRRVFISEVLQNLVHFQTAFISLLSDPKSKQLSRESCCLGLAACRGLSVAGCLSGGGLDPQNSQSHHLNDRLLRAFGQSKKYAGSLYMETSAQNVERIEQENRNEGSSNDRNSATRMMESFGMEDDIQETGGASGMGEAALGAYREMAGAAVSLGRPDVLFSLMLLSVTHPVWQSSGFRDHYNAASLLGEISGTGGVNMEEMRRSLRPHLGSLIPRLLRASHDPNKQTREQMGTLWLSLSGGGAEARSAITENLRPTIDLLIEDASEKLWRARVGACGALSEIIVSRSWEDLGGGEAVMDDDAIIDSDGCKSVTAGIRLLRLWRATTRALDDVRLTVRESGQALARAVRSLTVRLCDPSVAETSGELIYQDLSSTAVSKVQSNAGAAAATALRWLVKYGLNQPCAEATGFCISCLLGIVDTAKPPTLQPVLSQLIGSLLMAMSGLEPAALNYLQVRVSGQDVDSSEANGVSRYDHLERLRLNMAQNSPIAEALTKCLSNVRFVAINSQKAVIPELDSALRCGAGFATRAAAADAVTTLCSTCPSAFKFTGHSSTNPTVRLLRALYFASERERGAAAKDKMAHALGSLSELAPGHSVRVLAIRACERYINATGSNNDPDARRAAAAALRAIAVRASGQFTDGGSSDVWCTRILPMAFLGRKDEDGKVSSLWKEVWDEGGTATNATKKGDAFGLLLEEKLLPFLVRSCVSALSDVSWARRATACLALIELADMDVLSPAPRSVAQGQQETMNKESLTRARRRAQASATVLASCAKLIVKSRVWTGKSELVKATVKVAGKWARLGAMDSVDPYVWGFDQSIEGTTFFCPWAPIIQRCVDNDLFVGDRWFTTTVDKSDDASDIVKEHESPRKVEEIDKSAEATLDFKHCEDILGENEGSSNNDIDDVFETVVFSGLCRALLEQALPSATKPTLLDDTLSYRAATLQGLSQLLLATCLSRKNIQIDVRTMENKHAEYVYNMLAPQLISVIEPSSSTELKKSHPPLIVARSMECLAAAMWQGMGEKSHCEQSEDIAKLSRMFCESCGGKQPAWTVREASALAGASLVLNSAPAPLRKHETITTFLDCTVQTAKDRKFWRVRCAGLQVLHALVSRACSTTVGPLTATIKSHQVSKMDADGQLMLEALLPHKEKILKLSKSSLNDNEPKVTALATEICKIISWWP